MQSFVFTAYIIWAVILYTLSVKGNSFPVLFPTWRLVAMNLHVSAPSSFSTRDGSSQWVPCISEQTLDVPKLYSTLLRMTKGSSFPTKCSALFVLCFHLRSVLSSWWSLMDKEEPFLPCSAGAHWDQWNICCHCCWEDQGSSRAVIIPEDISFSPMFSVS